jgi:hypothetical protein
MFYLALFVFAKLSSLFSCNATENEALVIILGSI